MVTLLVIMEFKNTNTKPTRWITLLAERFQAHKSSSSVQSGQCSPLTLSVYLSGKDFPHILQCIGISAVCSFWTCSRRSVFLPHVVGQSSHWKTGLSPVWMRRWAFRELLCVNRAWQMSHS